MNHLLAPLVFSDSAPGRTQTIGGVKTTALAPVALDGKAAALLALDAPAAPDTRTLALERARIALALGSTSLAPAPHSQRFRRAASAAGELCRGIPSRMVALLRRGRTRMTGTSGQTHPHETTSSLDQVFGLQGAETPLPARPVTALPARPATSI